MVSQPEESPGTNVLAHLLCVLHTDCSQSLEDVLKLFDILAEHVVFTDPNGVILYANQGARRTTGFGSDDMAGRTPALWRLSGTDADEQAVWGAVVAQKQAHHGIVRNKRKDGTVYEADVQVVPIFGGDGAVRYCVDVERDVREASHLERTERRLMALTSHNLKTPLAAVRWQTEMLRDGDAGRLSKPQKECVEEILGSITRTISMIEQWFDVTKMDLGLYTFNNVPVDLNEAVQRVLANLEQRIEQEGVTVHFTPNTSPCGVIADSEVLDTIVHALLLNAVKFNRQGGTVEVQTLTLPPQSEYAGKTFSDTRAIFSVHDSGLGIPPEDQVKIFHEFFHGTNTSTTQAGGAGLGLYLTYAFVQKLAGDIWFTSTEQGSHFVVALPASNSAPDKFALQVKQE